VNYVAYYAIFFHCIKKPYKLGNNITLEKYVDDDYGFLRVKVTRKKMIVKLFTVSNPCTVDRFEIDLRNHKVSG
jgi:hypothetical protein